MHYKTSEIAKISGVSSRTLRYYDEINLLKANKIDSNGYRVYTDNEVDKLQMILFYREMGLPLEEIRTLISSNDFNQDEALNNHLTTLIAKKISLEKMILNVTQTINARKEGTKMSNNEKFNGLEFIAQNESKYGDELREKYGDEVINKSFEKLKKASYQDIQTATETLNNSLLTAFKTNDPSSDKAQHACENHKKLLLMTWPDGLYSKQSQLALVESFTQDDRFISYYENLEKGMMNFFYQATKIYCEL